MWEEIILDIAAMSTVLAQANVKMEANLAVMDHVKNFAQTQGDQLIEMMQQSTRQTIPHPTLGQKIDISV